MTAASRRSSPRRGATLLEAVVAGALLAAGTSIVLTMLVAASRERRALDSHRFAIQQAENLLARLCAQPFDALTPERVEQIRLAAPRHSASSGDQVQVELVSQPGPPESKRIAVIVAWRTASGQPGKSLRLTSWVHR